MPAVQEHPRCSSGSYGEGGYHGPKDRETDLCGMDPNSSTISILNVTLICRATSGPVKSSNRRGFAKPERRVPGAYPTTGRDGRSGSDSFLRVVHRCVRENRMHARTETPGVRRP